MRNVPSLPSPRSRCRLLVTASIAACFLPLAAQQAPVFKAETALVEVEVRVTDKTGQPVTDLSKEDFEMFENGQPESISTFEFVTQPVPGSPATKPGTPTDRSKPDLAEAASELSSSTFIYIATRGRREDRRHIFDAVKGFINENLAPGILVSIEGSPFTSRRSELYRELEAMLDRSSGGRGGGGFVDTLAVDLARDIDYSAAFEDLIEEANDEFESQLEEINARAVLYRRLRMYEYIDLIRALSIYPGRKVVVLFSTGLPVDEDNLDIMKALEDEATKARVRFYVSDVGRLSAVPPGGDAESAGNLDSLLGNPLDNGFQNQAQQRQDNQDGLYELARRTGGRAVLNSNDFGEVFDVVIRESGDYYLLGYYPSDTKQRGRLRRLRVHVRRNGLRVRHQRGYYEERPFELMSRTERNLRMHQALTFDTPYTDLPLRVDHEFFHNSHGSPTLVYSVGLHTRDIPSATVKKGETVKLTVIAQASGTETESGRRTPPIIDERRFEMIVDSSELERLSNDPNSWLHYGSQMPLEPGIYDWKVIVRDDLSGSLGSFQTQVRIPESQPRLSASSLLLTSRIDDISSTKPRKATRKSPEDVLQVAGSRFFASAVKSFRKGESIYLLYDVYNPGAESLLDPPSPRLALYRGQERVERLPVKGHQTVPDHKGNRIRYMAALATTNLPAGDYTIAAMLPSGTGEGPVIYRKFQIVNTATE